MNKINLSTFINLKSHSIKEVKKGFYTDTPANRKLGRVGQGYDGDAGKNTKDKEKFEYKEKSKEAESNEIGENLAKKLKEWSGTEFPMTVKGETVLIKDFNIKTPLEVKANKESNTYSLKFGKKYLGDYEPADLNGLIQRGFKDL